MIDEAFRRIMADLGRGWTLIAGRMWVIGLEKPVSYPVIGEKVEGRRTYSFCRFSTEISFFFAS